MAYEVVSLDRFHEIGRKHPERALGPAPGKPTLLGLMTRVAAHAMRDSFTDDALLTAGLNHYTEDLGWSLVSITDTQAFERP